MPEYTVLTAIAVVGTVLLEVLWLRTGLFRRAQYWISMAIVFFFQCLVDGWLTKLSDPIVQYAPQHMLGIRAPWDIPIEDFGFGFAMVTLTMLLWVRAGERDEEPQRSPSERQRDEEPQRSPSERQRDEEPPNPTLQRSPSERQRDEEPPHAH
ncbi:lycopene cyclase domain-containing protein [Mariniluteicoccus flavus]